MVGRAKNPHADALASPGGFVEPDEDAEQAAWCEFGEETGHHRGCLPPRTTCSYSAPDGASRMGVSVEGPAVHRGRQPAVRQRDGPRGPRTVGSEPCEPHRARGCSPTTRALTSRPVCRAPCTGGSRWLPLSARAQQTQPTPLVTRIPRGQQRPARKGERPHLTPRQGKPVATFSAVGTSGASAISKPAERVAAGESEGIAGRQWPTGCSRAW